jgi:hypothetical protein
MENLSIEALLFVSLQRRLAAPSASPDARATPEVSAENPLTHVPARQG